ncbi:hypothetical protein [Paenibacillus turpanensis]|uniref:hypothetical protein n=1 Tax=Paenibacillus turpanensis TaxID=2689078 RepID=UPI00140AD00B|nr:hypothetical protein [Paenibacillus turpanensis]
MSAKLLDEKNRIIEIIWDGLVSPEQVEAVNQQVEKFAKQLGGRFDVLVDMRSVKAFPQDTKEKLVEHQKLLKDWGMSRASVAVGGAIAKMQLNRVAKESDHQTEYQWESYEEALQFLRGSTVQ